MARGNNKNDDFGEKISFVWPRTCLFRARGATINDVNKKENKEGSKSDEETMGKDEEKISKTGKCVIWLK